MQGGGQQVELHIRNIAFVIQLWTWKLKDILVLWHCWRYERNSALMLPVLGNYC